MKINEDICTQHAKYKCSLASVSDSLSLKKHAQRHLLRANICITYSNLHYIYIYIYSIYLYTHIYSMK